MNSNTNINFTLILFFSILLHFSPEYTIFEIIDKRQKVVNKKQKKNIDNIDKKQKIIGLFYLFFDLFNHNTL